MNPELPRSPSFLPKILFGLVFLSVLFAGFLVFDNWQSRQKIDAMQVENQQIQSQINKLETEGQVGDLFASKQILDKAKEEKIIWSEITNNLLALENATEDLLFKQIRVTPEGAVVIGGSAESLKSIAILLQNIRESDLFEEPFVPSVNGEAGIYNFQLQFTYLDL